MIGKTISHYKIIEKLGGGGMGVVYKAEDTKLKRLVALKFLSPHASLDNKAKERFMHEAQAASALDHNNICTIYEIGESEDGQVYLAMALYEGESLLEKIERGPLPLEEATNIAVPIGEGLSAAHQKDIVHRDIKPANIMITTNGVVKILDFGLAKLSGLTKLTKEGTTLGTVAYMSPEQVAGESGDRRTDIWALGVILYEMITGISPFKGEYEQAVMYSIMNEDPEPLTGLRSGVPMELERVVNKAMAKNPDERYQHVDEMLTDLRALGKHLDSTRLKGKPTQVAEHKKNRSAYITIAVILVLVTFLGIYLWRGGERSTEESRIPRPLQVTLSQVTFSGDLEEYPSFSPNGINITYSRESDGYKHIFTKNLETGDITHLTKGTFDDIQPAWSPDGEKILFVRSNQVPGKLEPGDIFGLHSGGDIWMFDIRSGKEVKIIDEAFNPTFSPDGKRIAFDASWAGTRRIWTADPLGRNPLQVSFDPSEGVYHIMPRWSPDGLKIVFQNIEKTKFDIKVVDLGSKAVTSVTDDLFQDINPVWSQSGHVIYFSSYRSGGRNIWSIPISEDGKPLGQPLQVTTGAGEDVQLAISPDGKRLAFSILKINADIWRLPVSPQTGQPTGEPEAVIATTREDSRGAWSPDGSKIAFNSDRTGDMNIWVYSFEDGSVRQITKGPGGDYQPNWSPDGERLAFFSSRSGNSDIWVVEIETGDLKQLTKDVSIDFNPFFSPDGKFITFHSDRYGRMEVWVMNADGKAQRQLTNTGALSHFLRWSPDGKFVVYSTPADPRRQTLKVPLTGGEPQPFTDVVGGSHTSFSPDYSMVMDVSGHKTLWLSPVKSGTPAKVFEFEDPAIRMDYPVWSPDGKWVLFDRLKPQGGDIWVMKNFE